MVSLIFTCFFSVVSVFCMIWCFSMLLRLHGSLCRHGRRLLCLGVAPRALSLRCWCWWLRRGTWVADPCFHTFHFQQDEKGKTVKNRMKNGSFNVHPQKWSTSCMCMVHFVDILAGVQALMRLVGGLRLGQIAAFRNKFMTDWPPQQSSLQTSFNEKDPFHIVYMCYNVWCVCSSASNTTSQQHVHW